MSQSAVSFRLDVPTAPEDKSSLVSGLRDLDECRRAGMVSPEDFGLQRAEMLSELTCYHRGLWLGPVIAAGSFASVIGSVVWMLSMSWQATGMACGLAALFGLAMLGRTLREQIRHSQIKGKRAVLQSLLKYDVLTAEEYLFYDDRLLAGD